MSYTTDMKVLGKQLKAARSRSGMTQEQAAEAIGVIPLTISNWETGKKSPTLNTFIKLLNIYKEEFNTIAKEA